LQLAIQLPDLRRARIVPRINLTHPALRRIVRLYLPIAAGLIISQLQIIIDRRLASGTGPNSIARMANATQLIQFPHGLVSVAISLAVLPSLAQLSAQGELGQYRRTLAAGLRMVIVLIVPAIAGLFILGRPLIQLVFEHGHFTAVDTYWVTLALYGYLAGLFFASIDWPLNYAFYARQDTLTPALVGLLSVAVYLAVAIPLVGPLGMMGLVLADSAKQASHALTMVILLRRRVGPLRGGVSVTFLKSVGAAAGMALVIWLASQGLDRFLTIPGVAGKVMVVELPATAGGALYIRLALAFRMGDLGVLWGALQRRLARRPAAPDSGAI